MVTAAALEVVSRKVEPGRIAHGRERTLASRIEQGASAGHGPMPAAGTIAAIATSAASRRRSIAAIRGVRAGGWGAARTIGGRTRRLPG
jgi:hypothetical protein